MPLCACMPVAKFPPAASNAPPSAAQDELRPLAPSVDQVVQVIVTLHEGLAPAEIKVAEAFLRSLCIHHLSPLHFYNFLVFLKLRLRVSFENGLHSSLSIGHSFDFLNDVFGWFARHEISLLLGHEFPLNFSRNHWLSTVIAVFTINAIRTTWSH